MQKPLLLLLGAGCLISCHKEASNPSSDFTWFGTENSSVYNYVLINANQVLNNADSEELHIGVSAAFIDSNNHQLTSVKSLTVNELLIKPGYDSTYSYNYGGSFLNKASQVFGTRVMVHILGMNTADTVSSSVYVPKQLSGLLSGYPDTLSISHGQTLQWLPDSANTWGNVTIQVIYYSALSRLADSVMPENIPIVNLIVPDNGSYFLSKADLRSFPPHAYIGITIARGTQNEAVLPISRKRIYFFSSASLSTPVERITQ
jgi:hypothetical protein